MGIWVELAQLIAGAAAVVAIVMVVWDRRRQEYVGEVDRAAGVTAWRANAEREGSGVQIPGVVIENTSGEVAIRVDVKAGKFVAVLSDTRLRELRQRDDDSTPGVRLALLPAGAWFLALSEGDESAQLEVGEENGARRVSIPDSDKSGAKRSVYRIHPIGRIEVDAPAVQLLRFDLGRRRWWRDEHGVLHEDAKKLFWPWPPERQPAPTDWDHEFMASGMKPRPELTSRSDFTKYAWAGDGRRHTKFDTINLIASWWAAQRGIGDSEEFAADFGAELRKAVPDRAATFDPSKLLTVEPASRKNDGRPRELHIDLGGTMYGVYWDCGFKAAGGQGVAVHKPVIEYFIAQHRAPAQQSG